MHEVPALPPQEEQLRSRVFVIGAAGKVGKRLVNNLRSSGHDVAALHRQREQSAAISKTGAQPVFGNLIELDAAQLATSMAGSDVVIFTAGAGGAVLPAGGTPDSAVRITPERMAQLTGAEWVDVTVDYASADKSPAI